MASARGEFPSAEEVSNFHTLADTDTRDEAIHHTLGQGHFQAARGDDPRFGTGSGPSSAVPTGAIIMFGGAVAPTGYLLCDGASVLRTSYATLFGVIGTAYGSVDGTHFTLPDLRSRVAVGLGTDANFNALGKQGGATSHSHPLSLLGQALISIANGGPLRGRFVTSSAWTATRGTGGTSGASDTTAGLTLAAELAGATDAALSLQPYQVVNYIISTGL